MGELTGLDRLAANAAVKVAKGVNRRAFLQRTAIATSAGLASALGVANRAEANHNYTTRSGCFEDYAPDGCGDTFGCGNSPACHPSFCNGTHCTGQGHNPILTCDGYNCWTWTVCCQACGSGGTACYRWTCCDCTCGNPCGSYCSCDTPYRCICGVREYLGCFV